MVLRADDRAAPDLQALTIDLGDLLRSNGSAVVNALHALKNTRDPFEATRRAILWLEEAHATLAPALELHETISKERRAVGLLSMPWEGR